jgi:signal transduction histidine kinase
MICLAASAAGATEQGPAVLVLQSADRNHFWSREQLLGIDSVFSRLPAPLDVHIENLDLYRFSDESHKKNLAKLVFEKYALLGDDLKGIITTDDEAFNFLMNNLSPLGEGLPVVSTGSYAQTPEAIARARQKYKWVGLTNAWHNSETVQVALKLHPKTRRLFIIHDSSATAVGQFEELTRDLKNWLPSGIEVHEISKGTFAEIARELDALKDGDVAVRLRFYIDSDGHAMSFEQSMAFLREHTKVPIYSYWGATLGKGIVGGKLASGQDLGSKAAEQLVGLMQGEAPSLEPPQPVQVSKYSFDFNQLRRFGVDLRHLPPESIIINQPRMFYESHPVITVIAGSTIVLLSAFVLVLLRIVSKLRETQEELLKAMAAAEQASVTKTRFLANVSHEIRTPLTAIVGYADFLETKDTDETQKKEFIEKIRTNGALVSSLVNDILDLASAEFDHIRIEKTAVSLPEFIKSLNADAKALAENHKLSFQMSSQGALPKLITTDPIRMRQIIMNLIGNAVKYTQAGSVHAILSFEPTRFDANSDGKIRIDVTDTGVGIEARDYSRLFTPFLQVDSSMTRRFGGAGLGLTLSRDLARALGGDVVLAKSELGRGSTFTATIDAGKAQGTWGLSDLSLESSVAQPEASSMTPSPSLKNARILLAEDSPDNQAIIKRYLIKAGAEVELANDGAKAVELACAKNIDLILMDIQMPVLDGIEATVRLRRMGFCKPIIALTAHALKEQREKSLDAGCNEHLTKPVCKDSLILTIAHFLAEA